MYRTLIILWNNSHPSPEHLLQGKGHGGAGLAPQLLGGGGRGAGLIPQLLGAGGVVQA